MFLLLLLSENNQLRKIVMDKIPKLLCHSQDCERTVQLVTNKVLKTEGHDKQKSKLVVSQESSQQIPCKITKGDLVRHLKE